MRGANFRIFNFQRAADKRVLSDASEVQCALRCQGFCRDHAAGSARNRLKRGQLGSNIKTARNLAMGQFDTGILSARSMTMTSIGTFFGSSLSPSCDWRAVKRSGGGG